LVTVLSSRVCHSKAVSTAAGSSIDGFLRLRPQGAIRYPTRGIISLRGEAGDE
ncbi:unnamed protein product, partial [marine sediment metagenome]